MDHVGLVKARILDLVSRAEKRRVRPIVIERTILADGVSSKTVVKKALAELVRSGRLVYTYRDPCSFLEIPAVRGQAAAVPL